MSIWPRQQVREVADGIVTIVHGQGEVGVANASFVVEGKRAMVIDTMTFPEMAAGIVREIERRGACVDAVLNTHHHIDHVGGNTLFAEVPVVAHPVSIQALQQLGLPAARYDRLMPQFRGRFDTLELSIPESRLDQLVPPHGGALRAFPAAHTATDLTAWFPKSRVLIAGDLCFIGVTPLAVNGLISGWIAALDALIALQPAVVVPGHGPIGTGEDLIVLRDYFLAIQRIGQAAVAHNLSSQDALADLDRGPLTEWIEPERNLINLERAMQEASGEIHQMNLSAMPPSTRRS
jgi:glyoxylase-like metal-dependent hydrolase (beta-lactamase superfamily II)